MKNKRMKLARIEKDLSQAQLAEAVGVTRQTIGLIESGGYNPTLNLCIAICKTLGKTIDELFWEEEDNETANCSIGRRDPGSAGGEDLVRRRHDGPAAAPISRDLDRRRFLL